MKTGYRIALVSAFPPGRRTLSEYGFHLARAFAEQPEVAEVIVLADILPERAPELDLGPKIRVRRCWNFNRPDIPLAILRALFAEKPDGVVYNLHTASFGSSEIPAAMGLLTPALTRAFGWKSGVIAHNIIAGVDLNKTVLKEQWLRQAIVRAGGAVVTRVMARASYTTVTLRGYVDILAKLAPRADVSLVPHGTFDTEHRDWVPQQARPKRIVTMGKFGTYKRLETLLSAFDALRTMPDMEEVELAIGGTDHPNTPGYVAGLAKSREDDQKVHFLGYVAEEDVPSFFEGARLAIFDYEATTGSSGVLHQAATFGAVPIFPHIGDFVDLCRDEGLTGGDFPPGDVDALAEIMRDLLSDTERAESIARQNYEAVRAIPMSDIAAWHLGKLFNQSRKMRSFSKV